MARPGGIEGHIASTRRTLGDMIVALPDGKPVRFRPDPLKDLTPGKDRHHRGQDEHVERFVREGIDCSLAVSNRQHMVTGGFEFEADQIL